MALPQLSKLMTGVRFPLPAQNITEILSEARFLRTARSKVKVILAPNQAKLLRNPIFLI